MATSPPYLEMAPTQLALFPSTFSSVEHPANLSLSPVYSEDSMMIAAISRWSSADWSAFFDRDGSCGRTSPVSLVSTEDGRLDPFSGRFGNSGMGSPTECWTLSTSESPSDAVVSSFSDILEETGEHLRRYCLSPKACAGILERGSRRGKTLPSGLETALRFTASHGERNQ